MSTTLSAAVAMAAPLNLPTAAVVVAQPTQPNPISVAAAPVLAASNEPNTKSIGNTVDNAGWITPYATSTEHIALVAKYSNIFSKYAKSQRSELETADGKVKFGINCAHILDVLSEGESLLNNPKEEAVRQGGVYRTVHGKNFLFKVDEPTAKSQEAEANEKACAILHIFYTSNAERIGSGVVGIVLKIFDMLQGKFVPFKAVRLWRGTDDADKIICDKAIRDGVFPIQKQWYADNATNLALKVKSIKKEFAMINRLDKNPFKHFLTKSVTWIQVDPDFPFATGFVGNEILRDFFDIVKNNFPTNPAELKLAKIEHFKWCQQVMLIVKELRDRNIYYPDFKVDNLLMNEHDELVLSDFGNTFLFDDPTDQFTRGEYPGGHVTESENTALKETLEAIHANTSKKTASKEEALAKKEALAKDVTKFKQIAEGRTYFAVAVTIYTILAQTLPYEWNKYDGCIKPNTLALQWLDQWKEVGSLIPLMQEMLKEDPKQRIPFDEAHKKLNAIVIS